jgi:hypothetical protein
MIISMLEFQDMDNDLANEVSSGIHDYTVESESHGWGGSLWAFLLGGWIVSRWFRSDAPKEQEPIFENNETEMGSFLDTPSSIPKETKQVLSQIWLFEEEITKAEASGHWLRLYCLLQAVRHLLEKNWKPFIDGEMGEHQSFIDENLKQLLQMVLKMKPDSTYFSKVSNKVKKALESGNLELEEEDLSFSFNGKALIEEPWPEEFYN